MGMNDKSGICRIICAGEKCPLTFKPSADDLTIAADGGLDYLAQEGLVSDLFMGDCDSSRSCPPSDGVILPTVKDVTDTYAAAEEGLRRGYRRFEIYCALGGRLSHTLANIAVLRHIRKAGGDGVLIGRGAKVCVSCGRTEISGNVYFSVLPSGERAEAEITGAKYSGTFTFTDEDSLGVSNEPLEKKIAAVTVRGGEVIVIIEDKD